MEFLYKTKSVNSRLILMLIIIFASGTVLFAKNSSKETSKNTDKLWQARITSPDRQKDITTTRKINELISKIESLDFEKKTANKDDKKEKQEKEKPIQPEKVRKQQPENAQEGNAETEENKKQENKANEKENYNKKQTEKLIEKIVTKFEDAENPLELAHILLQGGYPEQAGIFYESALSKKQLSPTDKAWVLFQTGNCFEDSNPSKAEKSYKELLIKYKDCEWSKIAESKLEILQLKRENQLDELISKVRELCPAEKENNKLLSKAK